LSAGIYGVLVQIEGSHLGSGGVAVVAADELVEPDAASSIRPASAVSTALTGSHRPWPGLVAPQLDSAARQFAGIDRR